MHAFISHSSANADTAKNVERILADDGIDVWLDSSDIRVGTLLRTELQTAISEAQVLVLLWSKPAARSRWVAAELLTAFHMNRFVVPCMLDASQPPIFLQNTLALDMRPGRTDWGGSLVRAVAKAPKSKNQIPPTLSSQSQELQGAIQAAADAQSKVLHQLGSRETGKATELQGHVDTFMNVIKKAWPLEQMILNLCGYNEKNRYMLRHWAAIQAGRPPKNRLLEKAERYFFEALFANPNDYSALNGLGSVLIHSRDLDAAKFFIRRAIFLAKRDGLDYHEAKADLNLISRAQ